jgi:hypothetical protein
MVVMTEIQENKVPGNSPVMGGHTDIHENRSADSNVLKEHTDVVPSYACLLRKKVFTTYNNN